VKVVPLVGFLAFAFAAAAFGASFPPGAWHAALIKPAWNPPNWVFGAVWTILYLCIALAGYRVWQAPHEDGAAARLRFLVLGIWALQLALNAGWSWLFFGLKLPAIAFAEICAMLIAIVAFAIYARGLDRTASYLFMPYAAWVAFATCLNFALWRLNQ
jgi:translocator protein